MEDSDRGPVRSDPQLMIARNIGDKSFTSSTPIVYYPNPEQQLSSPDGLVTTQRYFGSTQGTFSNAGDSGHGDARLSAEGSAFFLL